MNVLTRVRELLAPPVFEDEEQTRQASLLNVMLLASMLISMLSGLPAIFLEGASRIVLLSTITGLLFQLIVMALLRRRQIRFASVLLCLGFWFIVTFSSLVSGGTSSPLLSFYGAIVLGAGLLLGNRAGAGFAGMSVASIVTMYHLQEQSVLSGFVPLTPALTLLDHIAALFSIVVILYLALRSLDNTLERARSGERAQIEANREMTALHASLEERVADLERAEKSLRDSETLYQSLVENLPQRIFLKDREGRFVFANQHFCDDLGKPRAEIVGKTDFDLHPRGLAEKYRSDDRRVMEQGKTLDMIEEHQVLGSETSYVQVIKTPTYDSGGHLTGVQGIFWDATERVRAENILRQSHLELEKRVEARTAELANERNLLRTLIDTLPDVIYVKDIQSRFILANEAQARLLGAKSAGGLVGLTDFDFFPRELSAKYYADEQTVFQTGQPLIGIEEPTVDPAGNRKWLITTKVPLRDRDGKMIGLVGMGRDITHQKHVEEALRESEERFRSLYENATIGIYRTTPDGRILMANPAAVRMLGYHSFDELAQRNLEEDGFEPSYLRHEFCRRLESEEVVTGLESAWHRSDGSTIFVSESARAIRDEHGKTLYYDGTFEDTTERKRVEEALYLTQFCVDHASIGIMRTGQDARILSANAQLCEMLGYTVDELCNLHIYDIDPLFPREKWQNHRQYLRSHGADTFESVHRRKDGTTFPAEITNNYLEFQGSGFSVSFVRDITERKRMEDALRESEERFRELFEASPDAVMLLDAGDPRWPVIDCNPVAGQMNGYTREELIGQSVDILNLSAADAAERAAYLERLRREGVLHYETLHRRKDGTVFPIEVSTKLIDLPGRELVLGIDRDITQRKQMEEALAKERNLLRTLIDHLPVFVYVKDAEGRYQVNNLAHARMLGFDASEEFVGKTVFEIFPPDLAEQFHADDLHVLQAGQEVIDREEPGLSRNPGDQVWNLTTKVPLWDDAEGRGVSRHYA